MTSKSRIAAVLRNFSAFLVKRVTSSPEQNLIELLSKDLDEAADEDLVWAALDELEKAQLLDAPTGRSADDNRISRRRLVRRLGLVGAMALLIPVVSSIVAPEPAEAESPPNGGGGTGSGSG